MDEKTIDLLLNNRTEARELLRCSLKTYIKVIHYYLYKQDFIFKDFHLSLINKLEQLVYNIDDTKHLCINIPVRCGKSQLVKYFISWLLSINKSNNFIYTSYSDRLVQKFSGEIRDLIDSYLYKTLFNIELKKDTTAKDLWKIEKGGQLLASPIKGSITGFGADFIVIDDPMNADDYKSTTEKENIIDLYNNTLKSRLDDKIKGRIILIQQRLAVDDLTGWIKENEKDLWDIVEVPAINEQGESIFEERLPLSYLEQVKNTSSYTFFSQYMQQPVMMGGNIIKSEWFKRYANEPTYFDNMFIVCDTAFSVKESADNSAFMLCGVYKGNLYILDVYAKKVDFPILKIDLKNFYFNALKKYGSYNTISTIWIENKASGQSLIQELLRENLPVRDLLPTIKLNGKEVVRDKYTRAQEVLTDIYDGYVYIPEIASWVSNFISEAEAFTGLGDTHDDQIDCLIYAIKIKRDFQQIDWKEVKNIFSR